jgi:Protein of unknown function (DUF3800)
LGGLHLRFAGVSPRLAASIFYTVHLLYLDDAGSAKNPNEQYLILGGVAVYEAQAHWITTELDSLAASLHPTNPNSVEFHASEIFSGRSVPWDGLIREQRKEVIRNVLRVLTRSYDTCKAFACAIHKDSFPGKDPMELAFEDLTSRFDIYLNNLSISRERQRGLIILDESSYETSLQSLATRFRQLGTQWGGIRHIADIPMFVNSKASRIVQLADHVAYATFRRYESGDASYFDIIAGRFYEAQGVVHGLAHKQLKDRNCMCPACITRRAANA